jgi:hypothetical protein
MFEEDDIKKGLGAIAIVLAVACFIGLGGGSFDAMILTTLPLYIGIRYLQTKGLI